MDETLSMRETEFFYSNVAGNWGKLGEFYPADDVYPNESLYPQDKEE